jgi:hypothetical protein
MEFALFYEIPVPRPWSRNAELDAYQAVIEQAVRADARALPATPIV